MPISEIQAKVLRTIAANRSPDSYVAGATVLNREDDTPRFSRDVDFFHDVADSVASSAEADAKTLAASGYKIEWLMRTPTFYRAIVTAEDEPLRMEWAQDSAFRFFPVQEDCLLGYRLHDADAATNKVLALAGRSEARDFVDMLHLNESYLSLGALAWAACGKDPGFTPDMLLGQVSRHVAYTREDVDRLSLRQPLDLTVMKKKWLQAVEDARTLIAALPPDEVGCLYCDSKGNPVTPEPGNKTFRSLARHRGCISGAWPTTAETS
jgi:hypothetical protein